MNPSRTWTSGSARCCFATWIVAASRRCNDSESVTRASESRSASIAARSVGDWADRRSAGETDKASRTIKGRRIGQLYPAAGTTFRRAIPSVVPRLKHATLRNPMQTRCTAAGAAPPRRGGAPPPQPAAATPPPGKSGGRAARRAKREPRAARGPPARLEQLAQRPAGGPGGETDGQHMVREPPDARDMSIQAEPRAGFARPPGAPLLRAPPIQRRPAEPVLPRYGERCGHAVRQRERHRPPHPSA